jgi:hypothetical protein
MPVEVSREEYERERARIEALRGEIAGLQERLLSVTAEAGRAEDGLRAAEEALRSERGRLAAYYRWRDYYHSLRNWRVVGHYNRLIEETRRTIEHLERSAAWWSGRLETLRRQARELRASIKKRRGELEEEERRFREKVVPKVWSYTLRVSARVVRGFAPGRSRRTAAFPPRWVDLTVELAEELAALPEEERRKRILDILRLGYPETKMKVKEIGLRSPIFVELSFESFVSSLDEKGLEAEYKDKLVELIKRYEPEIARYCNMLRVELSEFDFGVESKRGIEFKEETSRDFYEINLYPPSGYVQLVADGYYEHKV